jgi:hypothetical protein
MKDIERLLDAIGDAGASLQTVLLAHDEVDYPLGRMADADRVDFRVDFDEIQRRLRSMRRAVLAQKAQRRSR